MPASAVQDFNEFLLSENVRLAPQAVDLPNPREDTNRGFLPAEAAIMAVVASGIALLVAAVLGWSIAVIMAVGIVVKLACSVNWKWRRSGGVLSSEF